MKASFTFEADEQIAWVIDTSVNEISVTNAAEKVVASLPVEFLKGKPLIYRDTDERWDGLSYRIENDKPVFKGFYGLGASTFEEAKEMVLSLDDL
jgi:hypothetical protein